VSSLIDLVISILILLGAFLSIVGSLGLIRLPDVYTRLHAVTKGATLGVIFLLTAAVLYFLYEDNVFVGKLFLGILFTFLTAPVAGHMIGRAAYKTGVGLSDLSVQDDLKYSEEHKKRIRYKD
jgi:multicomponent Na+:H+ antiporter subunit G